MTIRSPDGYYILDPQGNWELDHHRVLDEYRNGTSPTQMFVYAFLLACVLVVTWPILILSIPFWNTRYARRLGFWLKRHLD